MRTSLPVFPALAAIAFDCQMALSEEQPGVQETAQAKQPTNQRALQGGGASSKIWRWVHA